MRRLHETKPKFPKHSTQKSSLIRTLYIRDLKSIKIYQTRNHHMNTKSLITSIFTITLGVFLASYQVSSYDIDDNYSIQFKTGKAEGTFSGLSGTVAFDKNDIRNSIIDVSVEVNTIQTGNKKKDSHARGEKWFDAEQYPQMRFTSTSIETKGNDLLVNGNLTVKDVTKSVSIPCTYDNSSGYLNGAFEINRKDYNIKGNFFGFTVGKNVDITLRIASRYETK